MKKALRIGYNRYYLDDIFRQHIDFIKRNVEVIDEIALFAEFSHYGYRDEKTSADNAKLLKDRIKKYRDVGVKSVGINILCTMGHIEEGWDVFPKAPLQYQVNEYGEESRACLCPSNDEFLDYTAKRYALYARTGADFIWLDDDIRSSNHGVARDFCYCRKCIEKFNKTNGTNFDRKQLVKLMATDKDIKEKWEIFKNDVMVKLVSVIEQAIHGENPKIEIGYMSYCDNAVKEWIEKSGAVKFRPGGGFYTEERPLELFEKCFSTQKQNENRPNYIKDIQYEFEAFNYQQLEKSIHISELETSLALMTGCNGVLYNNDIFCDRQDTLNMIKKSSNKWDIWVKVNENCKPAGVYCRDIYFSRLLNEISLPTTPAFDNSCAAVILGDELESMEDNEIQNIFKIGVLTDGKGLRILNKRGYGKLCGGQIKKEYESGMAERFGVRNINGVYKNYYRDAYMNYQPRSKSNAYEFEMCEGSEEISKLETITHNIIGTSMYINKEKSFAADGYLMPDSIKSAAKREQLLNVIDELSKNMLPIKVNSNVKIIPNITTDKCGGMNVMLTNASLDESGAVSCMVRSCRPFYFINEQGEYIPAVQGKAGNDTVINVDNIGAWKYVLLTNIL